MNRFVFALLFWVANAAHAQDDVQTVLQAAPRLGAADAATVLERARQNLAFLGIVQPTPEQISAALAGGVLLTPTGSTQMRGVLPQAARTQVRSLLEPDLRTP